jgi:XTP/dITP diphosphohydrolase
VIAQLLLASNNDHKHEEFIRLFPGVTVLTPRQAGLEFDFPEDGATFFANAHGKAEALYRLAGQPVVADDSGLCVDSLGGEPGIFSARYGSAPGGAPLEASARNRYLLGRMNGNTERAAHFVCCLVLFLGADRYVAAQETVSGTIARQPRGTNGFGYDPLFILPGGGQTMAEIADAEKDRISHRGRAARRILAILRDGVDAGEDGQWT